MCVKTHIYEFGPLDCFDIAHNERSEQFIQFYNSIPHSLHNFDDASGGGQDPGQWTACRVVVSVFFLRKIDIKLLPGSKIWGGCPIFTNLISFKLVQGSKFMGCIQIFPPLQFKKISVLSNFQLFFSENFQFISLFMSSLSISTPRFHHA